MSKGQIPVDDRSDSIADGLRMREREGSRPTVLLFTQDGCRDSDRVRACFRLSRVAFVERNVSEDADAMEALAASGVFATPLVRAEDRVLVGANLGALADAIGFQCQCPTGGH